MLPDFAKKPRSNMSQWQASYEDLSQSKRCERTSKKDNRLDEYRAATGKTDGER